MNITNAQNTSVENCKNPSKEENNSNVVDLTKKYQIQEDDLYSPDEDDSDSEESKKLTIKHSILSLKRFYEYTLKFPDPKYMFNLKEKGLTTPEKFVAWWNGNNPDFQITVDSIEEWTYREDEDPSRYNCHWGESENLNFVYPI
ncbi:10913_t:CDS:2 [Ambispora leptoticha]|uniref:10913_t:CDS:1 n=1 Tax=Ambispora leptoticha TaxID=144679 RepID=A0A9N8VQ14_9GLOM|nr:10913_t:CDS:2 [Ambispora leptoticha]